MFPICSEMAAEPNVDLRGRGADAMETQVEDDASIVARITQRDGNQIFGVDEEVQEAAIRARIAFCDEE